MSKQDYQEGLRGLVKQMVLHIVSVRSSTEIGNLIITPIQMARITLRSSEKAAKLRYQSSCTARISA